MLRRRSDDKKRRNPVLLTEYRLLFRRIQIKTNTQATPLRKAKHTNNPFSALDEYDDIDEEMDDDYTMDTDSKDRSTQDSSTPVTDNLQGDDSLKGQL